MKTSTRKRKTVVQDAAAFAFTFSGARYANKNELVAGNVTFTIAAVEHDPNGGFTGESRWKITVRRDDTGAFEIVTLPSNPKRDAQMQAAAEHIAAKGSIAGVRLAKSGNAYYFREARGT
jgi:hypothetical protein